jgi:hypothetical protein
MLVIFLGMTSEKGNGLWKGMWVRLWKESSVAQLSFTSAAGQVRRDWFRNGLGIRGASG